MNHSKKPWVIVMACAFLIAWCINASATLLANKSFSQRGDMVTQAATLGGATGQSLSTTSPTMDSSGLASSTLTLGNTAGTSTGLSGGLVRVLPANAVSGIVTIDQPRLWVTVDVDNCSWSAKLKGSPVSLDHVYFLPGNDASGYSVTAFLNANDTLYQQGFVTLTLHGTKPGQLDFDYHLSVSKTGNDIIVSLDRTNNTGASVPIGEMDYLATTNAQIGGTIDKWQSWGCTSSYTGRLHDKSNSYYELKMVSELAAPQGYEVTHVIRNVETDNLVLLGHLTVNKGHSMFEVTRTASDNSVKIRACCRYNITMPNGRSFLGEKLVVNLGCDGLRTLEHLGDLIALANDINLKVKRPLNLDDVALVSCTHSRFVSWMSGSNEANANAFIKNNGLDKFYYAAARFNPEFGTSTFWGLYYQGGYGLYGRKTDYPAECYLPVMLKWRFGETNNGRVIDFSNPVAVSAERERAFASVKGREAMVGWSHLDYSDLWDVWPGQKDPFMSAAETYRAGAAPWKEVVDTVCPRMRNRACMAPTDFLYGVADIVRNSDDADQSWSGLWRTLQGGAMRFFYNTRVFWNDCDNFHIYRYERGEFTYGQGKVASNFRCIAGSTVFPSERFDVAYPNDRLELLKRISPPTQDAGYPVDLFIRQPAQIWNMPIDRPFGKSCVLAVFNYDSSTPFTANVDAVKDLRLDSSKEYLVYEFWSKSFIGRFKGRFTSRAIPSEDVDIYSIVEMRDRPVLMSTSRHVRQLAFDIRTMAWDGVENVLSGVSRAVGGDPYQLRVYIPDGFSFGRVELPAGLTATTEISDEPKGSGKLLTVDYTTSNEDDVAWKIRFNRQARK